MIKNLFNFISVASETVFVKFAWLKKHQCDICGKYLSSNHRLKTHMQKHTGIREIYKCNFCEGKFTWKDSLNLHLKRKHGEMT